MTLESQLTKAHYYEGSELRLPFPVLRPEHVTLVLVDLQTGEETLVESGYTVTGCGTDRVDVQYPIPQGKKLTVYRELPLTQEMDLENGTAFDGEVVETHMDILAMQIQQVAEEVERSVKISVTSEEEAPTAEAIYAQVDKIADRAEDAVTRAEDAVSRSEAAADRAERAAEKAEEGAALDAGAYLRRVWVTEADVSPGETLTLPGHYHPARDTLMLHYEGALCSPIKAAVVGSGEYQYEEVGTDPNSLSNQVVVNFAIPAGSRLDMFVMASNFGGGGGGSGGSVTVARQKTVLDSGWPAATDFLVPAYIAGTNTLTVFVNGIFATLGDTYTEQGEPGVVSTSIKFVDAIPEGIEITAEVVTA